MPFIHTGNAIAFIAASSLYAGKRSIVQIDMPRKLPSLLDYYDAGRPSGLFISIS